MKEKILFISTSANWPKTDGKRQRTWFLLQALLTRFEVVFLFIGRKSEFDKIKESGQSFRELHFLQMDTDKYMGLGIPYIFLNKNEKKAIKIFKSTANSILQDVLLKNKFNFLFFRYIESYFAFNIQKNIPLAADIDDVYFEKQLSVITQTKPIGLKIKRVILYLLNLQKYRNAYRRINILFVTKKEDTKIKSLNSAVVLENLPFSMYERKEQSGTNTTKAIGFIGKLSYPPNSEGLTWFITKVLPDLVKVIPEIKLIIAGSGKSTSTFDKIIKSTKNVVLLGYVNNVTEFYESVSMTIVPVFSGGGSNIKIAESISFGIPVISSAFSTKGYNDAVQNGIVFVAKSRLDWVSQMQILFNNTERAFQYRKKSTDFVRKHYDLEQWNSILIRNLMPH